MPQSTLDEFLEHAGVKGMKWGKRKARSANYSDQQYKRDKQIYGGRGASRINKNLVKGDTISVARGAEKTRRDRVMGRNKYARQGGKIVGAASGATVGFVAVKALKRGLNTQTGVRIANKILGVQSAYALDAATTVLSNPAVQIAATTGAAKVGMMLSGDIGVAVNMRANGYDPSRR